MRLQMLGGLAALFAAPGLAAQETSIPDALLGLAGPLQGQHVHYVSGDTQTRGYLAVPEGDGPFPALILVHEWNGLQDRVRQVADAFAARGYVALAVDLFGGRTGSNPQENMALVREVQGNPTAMIANLNAAQRFLRSRSDVTGRVGVMGWCFGGGIALSYALGGEHHDATAIFYGSLVTDPAELARLNHPVYGTFAGEDRGIPEDQVRRFAAVLDSLGVRNDIHLYDPVRHGFWLRVDEDRATRLGPATDAWQRLMRFLQSTLHQH